MLRHKKHETGDACSRPKSNLHLRALEAMMKCVFMHKMFNNLHILHINYIHFAQLLYVVYCLLYVVYCLLYVVYCLLYVVYCLLYVVYCLLYVVYCLLYVVYCLLYVVYCLHLMAI